MDNERSHGSPFRFQCAWYSHPDLARWFSSTWSKGAEDICTKSTLFMEATKIWSREVFGDLNKKKMRLQARLEGIQRKIDQGVVNGLLRLDKELKSELDLILKQEEFICWQKSRTEWITSGERNTRYYHRIVSVRGQRKKINGFMDDDGSWVFDSSVIGNLIMNFFRKLYAVEGVSIPWSTFSNFPSVPNTEMDLVTAPILEQDVKAALFDMSPHKALGIDGIPASFYRKGWDTIKNDMITFVQLAFESGSIPSALNSTSMVLIPKVQHPEKPLNFIPSVCVLFYSNW